MVLYVNEGLGVRFHSCALLFRKRTVCALPSSSSTVYVGWTPYMLLAP